MRLLARPKITSSRLARLRSDTRGNVALLFILTVMVLMIGWISVWNTGNVASKKVRAQTAADAAAYSATVHMSRVMNMTTAGNMYIVRCASAETIAYTPIWTVPAVINNWIRAIRAAAAATWWCGGCGGPILASYLAAAEVPILADYAWDLGFPLGDPFLEILWDGKLRDRSDEIHDFQAALIQALPGAIAEQTESIAESYGVEIVLTQPGAENGAEGIGVALRDADEWTLGFIPPLEADFLVRMGLRVDRDRRGWARGLRGIRFGRGPREFNTAVAIATPIVYALYVDRPHYFDPTPDDAGWLGTERSATPDERRRRMTVVASASIGNASRSGESFAAPRIFRYGVNDSDTVLAIAQAETYNPIDGAFESAGLGFVPAWRVWTHPGWLWQARLAGADAVQAAIKSDERLRSALGSAGIPSNLAQDLERAIAH